MITAGSLCSFCSGIGTAWSTKIPNYDVREIVLNLKRMLDDQAPLEMVVGVTFALCLYRVEILAFIVHTVKCKILH